MNDFELKKIFDIYELKMSVCNTEDDVIIANENMIKEFGDDAMDLLLDYAMRTMGNGIGSLD